MTKYIIRRLLISIPIFIGITIIVFTFINLAPGDPITAMINPDAAHSMDTNALRRELGLDRPMAYRYLVWLSNIVRGNLGYSYTTREPVSRMIRTRLPFTLELAGVSLLAAIITGVSLGVLSALRQHAMADYAVTAFTFAGISMPGFVLALGMVYVFALRLRVLPPGGVSTLGIEPNAVDHLKHLIMPAFALGLHFMAGFVRYARSAMLEVLHADYLTVARAKGLMERIVITRHGLRNALMPVVTIIGLHLPALFGGSVIMEQIFNWPGMGQLYITAVNQRDYPVVMGLAFFSAMLVLASNLLADLAYVAIDPRIRYD